MNTKQVHELDDEEIDYELRVLELALQGVPFRPASLANRQAELIDEQRARAKEAVNV